MGVDNKMSKCTFRTQFELTMLNQSDYDMAQALMLHLK